MSAELLIAHFGPISDAPEAINRLRGFILDLAIRGKLVDQNHGEEPASDLLKRIRVLKVNAVKSGASRRERPFTDTSEVTLPFSIPAGWCWSRLAEIGFLNPRNSADDMDQASFIPMSMISAEYGNGHSHEIRTWGEIKSGFTHFAEGDVGLAKITPCFENGKSTVFRKLVGGIGAGTTELHVLRPVLVSPDYVLIFLKSPHFITTGIPRMTGTAGQKRLPTEHFAYSLFPVPPLHEQHRIVAKVDELMELCDRLEAAQKERESRRDQFTASAHHHLNNGADAEATRTHAQFFINHLPRLTARPEQMKHLRQSVLSLGIRGKLVQQSPKDEPACQLMKRIDSERLRLLRSGEVTKSRKTVVQERPFQPIELPSTWIATTLGNIAFDFRYGTSIKCRYEKVGEPVLRIPNIDNGHINTADMKFGPLSSREAEELRLRLGDILMVRSNGSLDLVGRPAMVESDTVGYCYAGYLVRVRTSTELLNTKYLVMVLKSRFVREQIEVPIRTTVGLKNVNTAELSSLTIPLPPRAEQDRIVKRVDELLSRCDHLEARLTAAEIEASSLLGSVLHHLLNPTRANSWLRP